MPPAPGWGRCLSLPHLVWLGRALALYVAAPSQFIWPGDDKSAEIAMLEAALGPIDVVIAGHCGLGFIEDDWINAGVIGMPPNEGRSETEFCILDGGATLYRLNYDVAGASAAMAGRATPYAEALMIGWWPSEDVLPDRLKRLKAA